MSDFVNREKGRKLRDWVYLLRFCSPQLTSPITFHILDEMSNTHTCRLRLLACQLDYSGEEEYVPSKKNRTVSPRSRCTCLL